MKDYTDITILLDRSGSMERIAIDTIGGINAFVREQKALPGDAVLSIVMFDSKSYDRTVDRVPIREMPNVESMSPRGGTPLLDAMARTIDEAGARFAALAERERPTHVVIVVVTDGEENESRYFTRAQVFAKVSHQRDHYRWLFLYLGANQDAIAVGRDMGIAAAHAGSYGVSGQSVNAMYRSVSSKVADHRAGLRAEEVGFTTNERASMWDEATQQQAPDPATKTE